MKIKYLGTPGEDHEAIVMYGYIFPLGKSIEVTDPLAIRKLANHPHFSAKGEDITDAEANAGEAELQMLAKAALEPLEANKAEEAATIANLTEEEKYGHDEPAGDPNPAEAQGYSGERGTRRGRPPKSR